MPIAHRLPDAGWDVGLRNVITDVERVDAPRQYENYNINLDPFYMKFGAGMRTAWCDNVNLGDKGHRMDDFVFTPHANVGMLWEISESNSLTTNLGLSYNKYLNNPDADSDTVLVSPESATDFTVFMGEHFRLLFYEQLAVLQDPGDSIDGNYGDPIVSNTYDYHRLYNTSGVTGIWNINKELTFSGGYRNTYVKALTDQFDIIDRMTHSVHGDLTYALGNSQEVGVFASTGWSDYVTGGNNDNLMTTLGMFFDTPVTDYLSARLTAAYVLGNFDEGGSIDDSDSMLNSYDVSGQFNHRVNEVLSHSVAAGHTVRLGVTSNYYELIYVRHSATWNVVKDLSVGTNGFVEFGSESDSYTGDDFMRWGGGLTLGYQVTNHLAASLGYTYIEKESDLSGNDYYQNRVTLDFDYRF